MRNLMVCKGGEGGVRELPPLRVGTRRGPEGLRQASRGRGATSTPRQEAPVCRQPPARAAAGGRGFPALGQEAPAEALRFPGVTDFSGPTSDSRAPLRSPSPRSGFGTPPASLPGAAARGRGRRRIKNRQARRRHVPGSLPARCRGTGGSAEARRALLSPQTLRCSAKEFTSERGSRRVGVSEAVGRSHPTKPQPRGWRETGPIPASTHPFKAKSPLLL